MRQDAAAPPSGLMSAYADGISGYLTFRRQSPRSYANIHASAYPTAKPFSPTNAMTILSIIAHS